MKGSEGENRREAEKGGVSGVEGKWRTEQEGRNEVREKEEEPEGVKESGERIREEEKERRGKEYQEDVELKERKGRGC